MADRDLASILAGIGLLVMLIVLWRACEHRVLAQDAQDNAPAVVLARVAAKEANLDGYADLPPIAAVLLKVGHGDVVRGARWHSRRVFEPSALGHRPWIAFLRGDGSQPFGWPGNVSWRNAGARWRQLVELAQVVLGQRGERPELPCSPDTWGGPMDRERARRIGYVRIDCGPTRNDFYVNPPRRARVARARTVAASRARGSFSTQ